MPQGGRNPVMRAHRLLCSGFITDEQFRAALGSQRADLTSIGRYLALPIGERPAITPYFDRAFYLVSNPDVMEAGFDPLLHFIETGAAELRAPHPLIDLRFIAESDPLVLGERPGPEAIFELLEYDLIAPSRISIRLSIVSGWAGWRRRTACCGIFSPGGRLRASRSIRISTLFGMPRSMAM